MAPWWTTLCRGGDCSGQSGGPVLVTSPKCKSAMLRTMKGLFEGNIYGEAE